ncbi:YitT family protein [Mesobacillus zeae]|uniref:YitT family protein n=1 Tax=Mesobacillus zeae TaxID=1917180 RepID=A0A398BDH9_9BACI|nr:YitT family protein [Mesobacillus zeae]RID85810.1 YitT family protein [Mesobacillus zeae]
MQTLGIVFGSLIVAIAFNLFLIPHQILSSGFGGISMMIGMLTPMDTGVANFLLNLPLLVLGYLKLGKKFIWNTVLSVLVLSAGLYALPAGSIAENEILSALFGGAVAGLGIGIVFRSAGSTGGIDIIAMIVTRKKDFPIGMLLSSMNAVVILASGFFFDWDTALTTLVSIYTTGKVIDAVYTHHMKLTLMIITGKGEEMKKQLLGNIYHGLTVLDGIGGYSNERRNVLMTVISRYELAQVKSLIANVDPTAFVNITETVEVMGLFHKDTG